MQYLTPEQRVCFYNDEFMTFIIYVNNGKYYSIQVNNCDNLTESFIIWDSREEMVKEIIWDSALIEVITDEALKKEVEFKELASAEAYKKMQDQYYYELELRKKK